MATQTVSIKALAPKQVAPSSTPATSSALASTPSTTLTPYFIGGAVGFVLVGLLVYQVTK